MIGGDRQSYGSRPISRRRPRTWPIFSGLNPDSMIDETNAANPGADQPFCGESSVWTKSRPWKACFGFVVARLAQTGYYEAVAARLRGD